MGMPRVTIEKWIEKATAIHGDKYDYSKTIYAGADNKLITIWEDEWKEICKRQLV